MKVTIRTPIRRYRPKITYKATPFCIGTRGAVKIAYEQRKGEVITKAIIAEAYPGHIRCMENLMSQKKIKKHDEKSK